MLLSLFVFTIEGQNANPRGKAVAGELVVKFRAGVKDEEIAHGLKLGRLKVKRHLQTEMMEVRGEDGLTLVETEEAIEATIERLRKHPAIEYVEPNFIYTHKAISNDQ